MRLSRLALAASLLFAATHPATPQDGELLRRAARIHLSSIVLDTHIDTTPDLRKPGWDFFQEHEDGHVDLPRMKKGGLNALFFSVYVPGTVTGPKAVTDALDRIESVWKLASDHPNTLSVCITAEDVRKAHREGKVAALIGMEGGHMINDSLPILRIYARLGVRYLTLTHSVNTAWADSSGDTPRHNGLTDFGRDVVRELNRLGVMVDISHVSDKTFADVLDISQAPAIASHSSCRAICGHPRNMTDEMIRRLASKGGVIQINYADEFLDNRLFLYMQNAESEIRQIAEKFPRKQDAERRRQEIERRFGPMPAVSWEKIVEHVDHAVKVAGIDHVGLGSDFDGATMPIGMDDVTHLPRITEALLRRGYSEADVRKILAENTLRLMEQVEGTARKLSHP